MRLNFYAPWWALLFLIPLIIPVYLFVIAPCVIIYKLSCLALEAHRRHRRVSYRV